ncbi:hypothetical protein, partial [Bacteroides pyogenes]|uniref:hypothetical protein n=1 Tax=Bacteroides pyogenes TaxID=310300 RepID=UPI002A9182B4
PQGTCPLTHYRALPEPILAGRQEKGAFAPFSAQTGYSVNLMSSDFRGITGRSPIIPRFT